MSAASQPVSTTLPPNDCTNMSRRELQAALRALKLPSGGTNDQLRLRLQSHQQGSVEQITSPPEAIPPPEATSTSTLTTPEKRLKKHRTSCPQQTSQRIERARTQTMYLLTKDEEVDMQALSCKFVVLGSTGNVYDVVIQRKPSCTCPDHRRGNLCKHILFVLLKVMGVPADSPMIYQAAWIGTELQEMFEGMKSRFQNVSGRVMANRLVQETYEKLKRGEEVNVKPAGVPRRTENDDCPICFDPLQSSENTTYCRLQCGANFHQKCIHHWLAQQRGKNATCPMCRGPWEDAAKWEIMPREGYTNLGCLQGQSPSRDTSSYYSSTNRKRQRR